MLCLDAISVFSHVIKSIMSLLEFKSHIAKMLFQAFMEGNAIVSPTLSALVLGVQLEDCLNFFFA